MKLDLKIMQEFTEMLGNPQADLHFAHVAGTNGKGSVSAFLYSIMKRKYRTGLYTSPHVERFTERIVVNDSEIPEEYIVNFVRRHRTEIELLEKNERNPTFFEVTTGLALQYFYDTKVDFAVMEVGLGGRLDATNVITPDISAIVSIDLEHTNVLGKSISRIAREKAGIIKNGVPVVVSVKKEEAVRVIEKVAHARGAPYHSIYDECDFEMEKMSLESMYFTVTTPIRKYSIKTGLIGVHQVRNAVVAIRMAELLQEKYSITHNDIERGMASAIWRGRLEVKRKKPLLIFDSAHNPAGARVLTETLKRLNLKEITFLFSMLADKDAETYLRILGRISERIIITEVSYYRAEKADVLADIAKRYFKYVTVIKRPCDALRYVIVNNKDIVVCGSIYLLGELEQCLRSL